MATPEVQFLQDLAVVTGVAAVTGILFQRIRFPLVFGLLTAGVIIGPHTPPFSLVQDLGTLEVLANLGVALLLFGLGLEFNLRTLKKFGMGALAVTTAEVLLMFGIGFQTGRWLGWSQLDAAFLGAMLSISSTAIIVAVLRELGRLDAESSRLVFAVLILEDIAAILILVLLSGYTATGHLPLGDAASVLLRMALFLLAFILFGLLIIPRLIDWIAIRFRPEVIVLAVLGLALGGAVLSDLAGFHVGLGAFLTGALCAEARHKASVEDRFRPIHDLFAAVFFVAIGTLVDFRVMADQWLPVTLVTVAIIVGKTVSGSVASFLAGYSPSTSFAVGGALAQIGEFSFVIAALGLSTGAMSPTLFPVIVGAAAITSFTSPLMIRGSDGIARRVERWVPLSVRTYASVYGTFLRGRDKLRIRDPAPLRRERRNALASAILLFVAWGGALVFQTRGTAFLESRNVPAAAVLYWALWLAVLVPSFVELDKHLRRWIQISHEMRGRATEGLGVRAVVRTTLYVGIFLLIGLPILVTTGPFVRGPLAFILWGAFVTGASLLLLRGIGQLHHRVSENLGKLLGEEHAPVAVPEVLATLVTRDFPTQFQIETITLPQQTLWAERRIHETKLRETTGASIVLLERADGRQLTPGPDTLLLPQDRVSLLGGPEQIATASELLSRLRDPERSHVPVHPGQIAIETEGPLDGVLLVESNLRSRHGLQVIAIQRDGKAIPNPGPGERIAGGDVLIVLGTPEQIFAAVEETRAARPTRP